VVEVNPKIPIITKASLQGSTIYLGFDKTGPIPTIEELKTLLTSAGARPSITKHQADLISAANHEVTFRVDVFNAHHSLDGSLATKIYQEKINLPTHFRQQTFAQRAIPHSDRLQAAVEHAIKTESGVSPMANMNELRAQLIDIFKKNGFLPRGASKVSGPAAVDIYLGATSKAEIAHLNAVVGNVEQLEQVALNNTNALQTMSRALRAKGVNVTPKGKPDVVLPPKTKDLDTKTIRKRIADEIKATRNPKGKIPQQVTAVSAAKGFRTPDIMKDIEFVKNMPDESMQPGTTLVTEVEALTRKTIANPSPTTKNALAAKLMELKQVQGALILSTRRAATALNYTPLTSMESSLAPGTMLGLTPQKLIEGGDVIVPPYPTNVPPQATAPASNPNVVPGATQAAEGGPSLVEQAFGAQEGRTTPPLREAEPIPTGKGARGTPGNPRKFSREELSSKPQSLAEKQIASRLTQFRNRKYFYDPATKMVYAKPVVDATAAKAGLKAGTASEGGILNKIAEALGMKTKPVGVSLAEFKAGKMPAAAAAETAATAGKIGKFLGKHPGAGIAGGLGIMAVFEALGMITPARQANQRIRQTEEMGAAMNPEAEYYRQAGPVQDQRLMQAQMMMQAMMAKQGVNMPFVGAGMPQLAQGQERIGG